VIETGFDEIGAALGGEPSGRVDALRVTGVSTDSRTTQPGDLFFALAGARFDGHQYVDQAVSRGAAACVVSQPVPGIDAPCLLVNDTLVALGTLAAHQRSLIAATVIAVTGSNGKTTTKSMIDHVLSTCLSGRAAPKSFNNHVGVPLTLLSAYPADEYLVVEIGSSAPGEVEALARLASPDAGVISSIGPAHLAGFGGIDGVAREKASLLLHVRDRGLAVIPADQPELPEALGDCQHDRDRPPELVTFGQTGGADLRITELSSDLSGTHFRINAGPQIHLALCGAHNAANAAAAFAVARWMGLEPDAIAAALATLPPADMRLNVTRQGELTVINDSYNANPASMAAAIEVLAGVASARRVLVAGDMLELGNDAPSWHERIGQQAARSGIELLIAAGAHARFTAAGARAANPDIDAVVCEDSEQASEAVAERLRPKDVVLVKGSRGMGMERVVREIVDE
jgi:UDP-N-acetylmuramoyl-tripeptide--D-alanyl-D-alanine ligase